MANQRLNAQISIGGTVAKSLTKGLTDTKGQIREVGGAIGKATSRQKELSNQIKTFGRQGRSVETLRRKYAEVTEEVERLKRKQEALKRLDMADVGGKFRNMRNEVGGLVRRTAMLGTAAAGGIFAISNSTAELGDEVAKRSDALGIQIGKYQELRYAAERSGVSTQKFDSNMQAFTKRLGEAAQGTGAAKDALDQMGLSAEALASMTPDEALDQVADRLQNVESHTKRVALVSDLFSRQGIGMINMLKGGSKMLEQFGEDARRTGYILSEQATRDAETFQDKLLDTKLSLAGLKNIVGSELMPVVSKMMGRFTGWMATNRDEVKRFASTFADRMEKAVPVIGNLASGLATVASKVGEATGKVATLVGGFDNLGMIIGTVIASKAIFSIGAFAVSLVKAGSALVSLVGAFPAVVGGIKAMSIAFMTTPIGWIVGGIAAVAGAAYLIYRNWDWIGPWFGKLWGGIKDAAAWAWDKLKTIVSFSPLGLIVNNWGSITDWFGNLWDGVKTVASTTWDWFKTMLSWSPLGLIVNNWGAITGWLGNLWDGVKADAQLGWNALGSIFDWSPLATISNAWSGLTGWFGNLWDGITATAEKALNWISGKLEWVGNTFSKVKGWLGFGGDDDEEKDAQPPRVGGSVRRPELGSEDRETEQRQRGRAIADNALPPARPSLAGGNANAGERRREITQQITNNLTLSVTRREGEAEQSYAERIAELVMEKINEKQEGALYDG
ncbi:hypothetical protein [Chromohalobacter nigrandesensis]|uniref:hypothetical protein n=1 Tax=Chromohalobacter nigrandesensis TaxID=119863 RepID=UPI001FF1FF91|nr:hypothetical protein [Chromohalobacter nigrandesensis]MCK0743556.1 hypothetical protein [Chromohalobacter nigrandesensis]